MSKPNAILAMALAHRAALQELAEQMFSNPEDMRAARMRASEAFEAASMHPRLKIVGQDVLQAALNEIGQIFHAPPSQPESDGLSGR